MRRAARRDREQDRQLDPARVSRRLGPGAAAGQHARPVRQGAPAGAAFTSALASALHPPAAPGATRRRLLHGDDDGGRPGDPPARPRRARGAGRPRPVRRRSRRAGGRAAVRGLHAWEARPLLRPVRPSAVRRAARPDRSEWVWQCTHVGGDRFAGNLVCFPEGLFFGRVGLGGRGAAPRPLPRRPRLPRAAIAAGPRTRCRCRRPSAPSGSAPG